jgi:hypothetical protein
LGVWYELGSLGVWYELGSLGVWYELGSLGVWYELDSLGSCNGSRCSNDYENHSIDQTKKSVFEIRVIFVRIFIIVVVISTKFVTGWFVD